ncbi:putative peptide ABC transporter permease protein [Methylocaldum marinum]|uniref:Putative peptide ABC transporter permease protein n=1 Tax=Methylocaldum marinum TaxID=1432792 RepID=A0A286P3X1_9GAMM|nr:putative peptide ABC transporter permease protein [Methylocaldum marinum]
MSATPRASRRLCGLPITQGGGPAVLRLRSRDPWLSEPASRREWQMRKGFPLLLRFGTLVPSGD